MLLDGARPDENVGGALRAATGRFTPLPEIVVAGSGSHLPTLFSRETQS
jgi:hypothetical protein